MANDTNVVPISVDSELYPALIQCFSIICFGYIAGQLNLLTTSHTTGLSRYISNFALPAVIFKNLVDVQFESISWRFLTSVLISKAIMFFLTMFLTYVAERPKNFASMGHYAIMTTQSNDFALILPIIDAVYRPSHPDFGRYIYLIAPISLAILNPIGFFLIEVQKRLDDQRRHRGKSWSYVHLISTVCRNISRNPIVVCTILGVIFNQIFKQELPGFIDCILTPLAQSFTATALFCLGLTMVGRLSRLHAHLVVTVFLLSIMKLVIFPLILRQAVFFLVKPVDGNWNYTIEYSNLGFLYGTSPIALSVIFYVPESMQALQAVASTGLVVSTVLAGPIILVSAKMINLRTLGTKLTEAYEVLLTRTAYDVSIVSLLCTIIVLVGFCLRHRSLKANFMHKYTFTFVGLQMVLAIWTIVMHHIKQSVSSTTSIVLELGSISIALATRTWVASLALALMCVVCHSTEVARRYSWMYHIFGWFVPVCVALIIYFSSLLNHSNEVPVLGTREFSKLQLILSILLLTLCIMIDTISLLRIARRTYRLRHESTEGQASRHNSTSGTNEVRPLIDEDEDQMDVPFTPKEVRPTDGDTQLFRRGILVALLTIDAVICVSVLLWLILSQNRDGIYYELQFLDTVLLHGQGIITFLVFALDADLLVPVTRKLIKLCACFGVNVNHSSAQLRTQTMEDDDELNFEGRIRPDFLQHTGIDSSTDIVFSGNEFCQWLETNGYNEDRLAAEAYFRQLLNNQRVIRLAANQNVEDNDILAGRYAFSK